MLYFIYVALPTNIPLPPRNNIHVPSNVALLLPNMLKPVSMAGLPPPTITTAQTRVVASSRTPVTQNKLLTPTSLGSVPTTPSHQSFPRKLNIIPHF